MGKGSNNRQFYLNLHENTATTQVHSFMVSVPSLEVLAEGSCVFTYGELLSQEHTGSQLITIIFHLKYLLIKLADPKIF